MIIGDNDLLKAARNGNADALGNGTAIRNLRIDDSYIATMGKRGYLMLDNFDAHAPGSHDVKAINKNVMNLGGIS